MILYTVIASVILFVMWIIFANVKKYANRDSPVPIEILARLWMFIFGVVDVVYNFIFGSIIFLQLPSFKRLTLTARLRYILLETDSTKWRWKLAIVVCNKLVEPWDWNHCGLSQ